MRAVLTALLLTATQASAQEAWPYAEPHEEQRAQDELYLQAEGQYLAVLTYLNSADQFSRQNSHILQDGPFQVEASIEVTPGPEILTVTTTEGCQADPEEVEVADGEAVHVIIQCGLPGV